MENYPNWEFAPLNGGEEQGFNDPGIETFTGNYEKSLAREIIQNSLDAPLNNEQPVIVEFQQFELNTNELPGITKFREIYKCCLDLMKGNEKAEKFFNNGIQLLEGEKISILKISDYNTKGVCGGDRERNNAWYSLVKSQGASSKSGDEVGSFGIGKNAPFAASALRTVFYSTLNDKGENVFQGKAKLVSHEYSGSVRQGTGQYGMPSQSSIRLVEHIPELFRRNERGLDIFIVSYLGNQETWQKNLIKTILENFWLAIYSKNLIVKINGREINDKTIRSDFIEVDTIEQPDSAYHYFRSFVEPSIPAFETELKSLGKVCLKIYCQENLPRSISFMRKNMEIYRSNFRVSRIPYVGVFFCESKHGNQLLRELEPPKHNIWDSNRSPDGKKIIHEIHDWIRTCLRTLSPVNADSALSISELYKFLPADSDYEEEIGELGGITYKDSSSQTETYKQSTSVNEQTSKEVYVARQEPVTTKNESGDFEVESEGESDGLKGGAAHGNGSSGTGGGDEKGFGSGANGSGRSSSDIQKNEKRKTIQLRCRSFITGYTEHETTYTVILSSSKTITCDVELFNVGDDIHTPAEILNVTRSDSHESCAISASTVKNLIVDSNKKVYLRVTIKGKNNFALGVIGYEN